MSLRMRFVFLLAMLAGASCNDSGPDGARDIIAMRFVALPPNVEINAPFSVTVELLGEDGERNPSATSRVTLSLIGTGTLQGATTATPAGGLATFSDLRITSASESLQLRATAAGIVATSPTFRASDDCAPVPVAFPVSLTATLGENGCVVDGRPAAFLRFTKPEIGPAQFVVTAANGAFVPEITLLNDPPVDVIPAAGSGATATVNSILPGAPYRLRISSTPGASGPFTVTTTTTPPQGCVLRTLLPFALVTYTERLDTTDCTDGPRSYDRYQVYSPKPCAIVVRAADASFDPLLGIRNARTHEVVAEDDNAGGGVAGKDALVILTECRAGTDPIEILAAGTPAGDYSLIVQITGGVSTFAIGRGTGR